MDANTDANTDRKDSFGSLVSACIVSTRAQQGVALPVESPFWDADYFGDDLGEELYDETHRCLTGMYHVRRHIHSYTYIHSV